MDKIKIKEALPIGSYNQIAAKTGLNAQSIKAWFNGRDDVFNDDNQTMILSEALNLLLVETRKKIELLKACGVRFEA